VDHTTDRLDGLRERRPAILERWKALALAVYPERALGFLKKRDRFRNPIGHVLDENLAILFDGVVDGASPESLQAALDAIVRVRAVQDLSPSAAVGFALRLKRAIREELGESADAEIDERVDRLALQALDQYVRCREQIYELRLREIRGGAPGPLAALRARAIENADRAAADSVEPETRGGCAG
jgi:hypothetical protein